MRLFEVKECDFVIISLLKIGMNIFKEADHNQYQKNSNWKCRNNSYTLKTIQGVFSKKESDWKKNKHNAPEATNFP